MLKKGTIPVPYIIALILGIVVVGILGYGFFVLGWKIPGLSAELQCNARKDSYCTEWARSGYDAEPQGGVWESYAPGCKDIGVAKPSKYDCKLLFGLKPTGTACTNETQCASDSCQDCTSYPCTDGVCG